MDKKLPGVYGITIVLILEGGLNTKNCIYRLKPKVQAVFSS